MNSIQEFILKTSKEYIATESLTLSPIYELSVQQLNKIGEILKQCIALKRLYFEANHLDHFEKEEWSAFCKIISCCPALESISFSRSGIANLSQQQWNILSQTFQKMGITSLDFGRNELNEIDELSWKALCGTIASCHKLKTVILDGNQLGEFDTEQWLELKSALSKKNIENLSLFGNELHMLDTSSWQVIADIIKDSHSLVNLNLSDNDFGLLSTEDITILAQAIQSCVSLQDFDVDIETFDKEDWMVLRNTLENHPLLKEIDWKAREVISRITIEEDE